MKALLPPNATQFKKDVAELIEQSTSLEVAIKNLWNPYTCPSKLLPWLAWAYSVDRWESSWPDGIKRQLIQDSFELHRFKGTPHAVEQALLSLNINATQKEWWELNQNGVPGTFKVLALLNENLADGDTLLSPEMMDLVIEMINHAKRGSAHFNLELGLKFDESFALASAGNQLFLSDLTLTGIRP